MAATKVILREIFVLGVAVVPPEIALLTSTMGAGFFPHWQKKSKISTDPRKLAYKLSIGDCSDAFLISGTPRLAILAIVRS